jgi:hypothetical protein
MRRVADWDVDAALIENTPGLMDHLDDFDPEFQYLRAHGYYISVQLLDPASLGKFACRKRLLEASRPKARLCKHAVVRCCWLLFMGHCCRSWAFVVCWLLVVVVVVVVVVLHSPARRVHEQQGLKKQDAAD